MRSTFASATVRLYHLADDPGAAGATTLMYGPLEEALRMAAQQPEDVRENLYIATDNDVVAYLDLIGE